ncbi:N,N-dimethylformamidase beta subunit family domain-containing protein [Beijerinckia sp. L45]|uniref:N,N-dimethylformamidase beta subunit family domain-containing protein n=1 Tax=Beijerinckia sp. L45 TaxID=1641855 RepID=UPI00131D31BC|nr:N,N-dimethylformamidase beta subunit family domain-containing protein [Beijerinckia sp. L45]
MNIQAYFEEWSRAPGETVRMAVSTAHRQVHATLVRLLSGPARDGQSVGRTRACPDVLDKNFAGRLQTTAVGSYATLPVPAAPTGATTIHCWIWPTLPKHATPQAVWSVGRLALVIADGTLQLRDGATTLVGLAKPVITRTWSAVTVTLDGTDATLTLAIVDKRPRHTAITAPCSLVVSSQTFMLAASGVAATGPIAAFNGKIDSPALYVGPFTPADIDAVGRGLAPSTSPWAAWELAADYASETIASLTGAAPGHLFNGVERGVTGRAWDGTSDSFIESPAHYTALQFHDDDMVDAGWAYDLSFDLPKTLESGVYAVQLDADGASSHIPLFVCAASDATAPILFLVPTNTYLAYGNDHLASLDFSSVMPHDKVVPADEEYLFAHREPGRSCYDTHADGTPVRYSSRRRPLVNVRPGFPNWLTGSYRHFPVDMYIVEWLEHVGLPYHVATDEDLEHKGRGLLDRYAVVVTGSHPEYWSRSGLDTLDAYLGDGGRIMYLGGNGFYWVTSRFAERPWVIEVRRDNSGTRCWDAPYGERTHVATCEAGGIWRTRGRAPNKMLGVGFASEGWSQGCGYKRLPASYSPMATRFFDGVETDVVGDYGHVLGGAVGDEVDRYDIALGSPVDALVLATSTGLGNEYQLVIEDLTLSLPHQGGAQRPEVIRADIVLFARMGGGGVFSVGSITYGGALAWNDCDNALSRLTANVLQAFAAPGPFLLSDAAQA